MEIAFEYLLGVREAVKGTAINPPTHYLNMVGTITPRLEHYEPEEARGTLEENYRGAVVRKWSELEAEGPADVYTLPLLLEACIKGAAVITTPGGGTDSRLHTYVPTLTSDDLQSLTLYGGDPNVQAFQADFYMIDEITISADASGTDGVTQSAKGQGHFPAQTAPASLPSFLDAPLLVPSDMELWIDSGAAAIGTTPIAARLISSEWTIPSGVVYKWLATGPTGTREFVQIGRKKRRAEMKLVLEVPDMTEYDQFVAATELKVRCRLNGPLIEGALYHYIQMDIYGPFQALDWGEFEGTNRTIALTIRSRYNSVAGHSFQVLVQNDRATL